MKIILAPDSFKGNLTSLQVAKALEKGIHRVLPKAKCIKVPMADGGEGTVQSLVHATGGRVVRKKVVGPLGEKVVARYGIIHDGLTAVVEMAEASGLPYVEGRQKNPLKTTTFGTGELLLDAINRGVNKIIIGIGGSATIDGGMGMAQALGVVFYNHCGEKITQYGSGGILKEVKHIDLQGVNSKVRKTEIIIAADVTNPLFGKQGAAYVFGPQKGATPDMVKYLDEGLRHFYQVVKQETKQDVSKMPSSGAAGGLGAGLIVFAQAKLRSGVDIILEATGIIAYLKKADLVFTGEGRIDKQTAFGKTPFGVAKLAKKFKIPTIAIGGSLSDDASNVFAHGIEGIESACARVMTLEEALAQSKISLANAAERVIRLILIGKDLKKTKNQNIKKQ